MFQNFVFIAMENSSEKMGFPDMNLTLPNQKPDIGGGLGVSSF